MTSRRDFLALLGLGGVAAAVPVTKAVLPKILPASPVPPTIASPAPSGSGRAQLSILDEDGHELTAVILLYPEMTYTSHLQFPVMRGELVPEMIEVPTEITVRGYIDSVVCGEPRDFLYLDGKATLKYNLIGKETNEFYFPVTYGQELTRCLDGSFEFRGKCLDQVKIVYVWRADEEA